jgi:O-antigen/teichoic acid export membrane protein
VLARLLTPADYGIIAMITVFIAVASVFVESGFSTALIQKNKVSDTDYSSVFYLSLTIAGLLYLVLFFTAPWVAIFYNMPVLVWVLRLLAVSLILGAINSIQVAVLTREMKFYLTFKVSIITVFATGITGITLAYMGYGVWSLVWSILVGQICSTIAFWFTVNWRPKLLFSWQALRTLFGFGSNLLGSGLLDTIFTNLYPLIIGKLFDATILGYYTRGRSIPGLAADSINGTIAGVMFPALSSCQEDRVRVKSIVRRMIVTTCFFVFPMMFGLAVIAKPLVLVLLTDKWLPCVPFLQLACVNFAFLPVTVANLQAITAVGRSDIFLILEIIKKSLILATILLTFRHGVMAMVIGQTILAPACILINGWPNKRLLNYSPYEQIKDIAPTLLLGSGMGALVWGVGWLIPNTYLQLITQIIFGSSVYFAGAKLLKFESAEYMWRTGCQMLGPQFKRFD